MKCPKCDKETVFNNTEIKTFKVLGIGEAWPLKILCQCNKIHKCNDCNVLITESEMRDYIPC